MAAALEAQLHARGLSKPAQKTSVAPLRFFASAALSSTSLTAGEWAAAAVEEVSVHVRKTGNHVCRPDVCHKGPNGRQGFCRFLF